MSQINDKLQTIVLGGGCFWCTEAVYVQVRGVTDVESGYSNGHAKNPSYQDVCTGATGHAEVVKLEYDPSQVSTRQILEIFFTVHDPTQLNRQGNDTGTQYRSGIYYTTPEQKQEAEAIIAELTREHEYDAKIVTEVKPLENYWPAEDYHQEYFRNNPAQPYCAYVVAPKVAKFRSKFAEKLRKP